MEKLSEILQGSNLSTQSTSISTINNNEISIYKGTLTKECVKANCLKILVAFPSLESHFTDLLTESLFRNNFTDERFKDAVNFVIDNCRYPKPSIADFVGYDKKIKLLTYNDMVNGSLDFDRHKKVRISASQEKPLYVRDIDFELNNFENW